MVLRDEEEQRLYMSRGAFQRIYPFHVSGLITEHVIPLPDLRQQAVRPLDVKPVSGLLKARRRRCEPLARNI